MAAGSMASSSRG